MFKVPKLNIEANDYCDMIDWQELAITETAGTRSMSKADIEENIQSQIIFQAPEFPNHTQAVERCVKLVTEAPVAVVGEKKRGGFIRNKIISRKNKIVSLFESVWVPKNIWKKDKKMLEIRQK